MDLGREDQISIVKEERMMKSQNLKMMMISQNPNFIEPNNGQCQRLLHPIMSCNFSPSPSSNGQADRDDDVDENDDEKEDEDMANCLILLAQGPPASSSSSPSLRKFMGLPEGQNGAGKTEGCCAYECKTCNRTFPSFQALGGHRSSHKNAAGNRNPISVASPANKRPQFFNNDIISSPIDQLRLSRRSDYNYSDKFKLVNNNTKIHQCSICGAGFMSGQALGGHMRRHRRVCNGASEDSVEIDRRRRAKKQRSDDLLCRFDLDLNLPAPEDDTRDQSDVVQIAATPLVGCHY